MSDYLDFHADLSSVEAVAAYDELPLWSAMAGLLLLQHVPMQPNLAVLDVGCGTGFPLLELAQRLGPGSTVAGIDPWEAAVERARFKAQVWGLGNIDIRVGVAELLPFSNGSFDLIVSNLGINNVGDPAVVLAECRRVARPTGRLALTSNLQGHMAEFYDVFGATLEELDVQKALPALRRHVEHRLTLDRLTELLSKSGWMATKTVEQCATMRFADGAALLRHYFVKLGFLDGWKEVVPPQEQSRVFGRLEANLDRLAATRGELELTVPLAYVQAIADF